MLKLVEAIRAGDRRRLGELYERNIGLLHMIARRYLGACARDRAVDIDDLMQAGFLGLLSATDAWEPDRGAWSTCATFHIRRAMASAVGLVGTRVRLHLGAMSLDAPIPGGDGEGASPLDMLAAGGLPDLDEDLLRGEIVRTVRAAVDAIPNAGQAEVIRLRGIDAMTLTATGRRMGCSPDRVRTFERQGLNALRRDKDLRQLMKAYYLDQDTRFYAHKGVTDFMSDWTSTTEAAALWRVERRTKDEAAEQG